MTRHESVGGGGTRCAGLCLTQGAEWPDRRARASRGESDPLTAAGAAPIGLFRSIPSSNLSTKESPDGATVSFVLQHRRQSAEQTPLALLLLWRLLSCCPFRQLPGRRQQPTRPRRRPDLSNTESWSANTATPLIGWPRFPATASCFGSINSRRSPSASAWHERRCGLRRWRQPHRHPGRRSRATRLLFDYRAKCEQVLTCDVLPNGNLLLGRTRAVPGGRR